MADFLTHINLNQNEIQNVTLQNLATDPANPRVGQFWFNTTTSKFSFYDGTNICTYLTEAEAVANYQAKITAVGILKCSGAGNVTAAVAGTDYDYAVLVGSTDPTMATVGAVGQRYVNTVSQVSFVCTAVTEGASGPEYTWDYVVKATPNRALVSDSNGKVVASDVTATELSYLSGVTSSIQSQLDAIPKLVYKEGSSCTVPDGSTQSDIDAAAIAAIQADYTRRSETPELWDAVNVQITFTPSSDIVKNGLYYYDGTAWTFLYYTTTGIQLAEGIIAGLIQEEDVPEFSETETYDVGDRVKRTTLNKFYVCIVEVETAGAWDATNWAEIPFVSDLTIRNGVATVNRASQLRTARSFNVQGNYGSTPSTDGIASTAVSFDGTGNATIIITGIKPEMLSGIVPVNLGGTGKSSITEGNVLVGNASGGFDELDIDDTVTENSDNLVTSGAVAAAIGGGDVAHKYTELNAVLTPSGGVCTWTVTHNLDTTGVLVQLYEESTGKQVIPEITITSDTVVTIGINAQSAIAAETYRVVVIG